MTWKSRSISRLINFKIPTINCDFWHKRWHIVVLNGISFISVQGCSSKAWLFTISEIYLDFVYVMDSFEIYFVNIILLFTFNKFNIFKYAFQCLLFITVCNWNLLMYFIQICWNQIFYSQKIKTGITFIHNKNNIVDFLNKCLRWF